jgi:antitoxin (DNA-binding transcriptional repressor) of toxin-antitoxin stability system
MRPVASPQLADCTRRAKVAKLEELFMQVTVRAAKANLSKLIDAALPGEEVAIAKGRRPLVKLVPVPQRTFKIGFLRDQLKGPGPDFLKPMKERDLALWEGSSPTV